MMRSSAITLNKNKPHIATVIYQKIFVISYGTIVTKLSLFVLPLDDKQLLISYVPYFVHNEIFILFCNSIIYVTHKVGPGHLRTVQVVIFLSSMCVSSM